MDILESTIEADLADKLSEMECFKELDETEYLVLVSEALGSVRHPFVISLLYTIDGNLDGFGKWVADAPKSRGGGDDSLEAEIEWDSWIDELIDEHGEDIVDEMGKRLDKVVREHREEINLLMQARKLENSPMHAGTKD